MAWISWRAFAALWAFNRGINAMKPMTLTTPIKRGDTEIKTVTLRKPDVGSLRGTKMTDVVQMDVNAMLLVLPRVTEPALLPAEVAALDPADFLNLSSYLISFFMSAEERAQMASDLNLPIRS
jgi:hypothetical protein